VFDLVSVVCTFSMSKPPESICANQQADWFQSQQFCALGCFTANLCPSDHAYFTSDQLYLLLHCHWPALIIACQTSSHTKCRYFVFQVFMRIHYWLKWTAVHEAFHAFLILAITTASYTAVVTMVKKCSFPSPISSLALLALSEANEPSVRHFQTDNALVLYKHLFTSLHCALPV